MADLSFLVLFGGGAALLAAGGWLRRRGRDRAARRVGMRPVADLQALPGELAATALWAVCDGGRERSVIGGTASLGVHDVAITVFELEAMRDVRGEWAYLPVVPPFRIESPLTVVACALPRQIPHLLAKRPGRADTIADGDADVRTMAALVREAMQIGRVIAADRPATLPAQPVSEGPLGPSWRIWAEDDALARRVFADGFGERAARVLPGMELVLEAVGGLVLLYPASGHLLDPDEIAAAVELAQALCERILAVDPRVDPRGVVP